MPFWDLVHPGSMVTSPAFIKNLMNYKSNFLWRLTLRIESAQRRVMEDPGNMHHEIYVKSLRLLYRELDAMPEDHLLFRNWARERWTPAALSDSAHRPPAANDHDIQGAGQFRATRPGSAW